MDLWENILITIQVLCKIERDLNNCIHFLRSTNWLHLTLSEERIKGKQRRPNQLRGQELKEVHKNHKP